MFLSNGHSVRSHSGQQFQMFTNPLNIFAIYQTSTPLHHPTFTPAPPSPSPSTPSPPSPAQGASGYCFNGNCPTPGKQCQVSTTNPNTGQVPQCKSGKLTRYTHHLESKVRKILAKSPIPIFDVSLGETG